MSARRQRGYTLIEVIVAFAILALALTLLLGILSNATRQVRWAAGAGRAALHAESLLAQIGVGEALREGQREGEFEDGRYRWTLDVAPWQDPSAPPSNMQPIDPGAPMLYVFQLQVRWGEGGPRDRLQLQSLRLVTPTLQGGVPPP
jgi:general secretion pathway protein I